MKYRLTIFLVLLFAITGFLRVFASDTLHPDADSLYIKGKEYADAGYYHEAARLWVEYADSGIAPDFKLSQDLISLVTKHRLTGYYEDASRIYFWGLEMQELSDDVKQHLESELFYIESMLGQREARDLRRMIERGDTEILDFLNAFWLNRTLTPSDNYNERLLEHWERVNYAKENFNTSRNEEFDARGGIYIRFGEPQASRSGIFMYNPGFVNYIVATRMDDGRGAGTAVENAINTTMYLNTIYQVRNYHQYPSFEVWVYRGLSSAPDNTIYIFGNDSGGNTMRLKQSVDDFIPSAAYSAGNRNSPMSMSMVEAAGSGGASAGSGTFDADNRGGDTDVILDGGAAGISGSEIITPALVLQFMYYRQLASLDSYFSSRYEEMLDRYMNTSVRLSRSAAREFQQLNSARLLIARRDVPEERSSNRYELFDIRPEVHAYRFVDENLQPYLKVFVDEQAEEAITFGELRKRNNLDDIRYDDYEFVRTIKLTSAEGEEFSRTVRMNASQADPDPLSHNVIDVPYRGLPGNIQVFSELYDIENGERAGIADNSTLRQNLKGLGRASAGFGEKVVREGMFASDVIIGYTDENDHFVVSHSREIPEGAAVQFYYEAYNLPQDDSGLYTFNLTYKLTRKRTTLGRIIRFGRESYTSMSIENTTDVPRFEQQLEIISDQLRAGSYELELILTGIDSEETIYSTAIPIRVR
jgi:GWxTD domain-containing protein